MHRTVGGYKPVINIILKNPYVALACCFKQCETEFNHFWTFKNTQKGNFKQRAAWKKELILKGQRDDEKLYCASVSDH